MKNNFDEWIGFVNIENFGQLKKKNYNNLSDLKMI